MYNSATVRFKWACCVSLGNVSIFTIFYRENIFQFMYQLNELLKYQFLCWNYLCSSFFTVIHKVFYCKIELMYKNTALCHNKVSIYYLCFW